MGSLLRVSTVLILVWRRFWLLGAALFLEELIASALVGLRGVFESESKNAEDAGAPVTAGAQALGAFVTAGESKEITALIEVRESDFSKTDGVAVAAATAGAFATAAALLEVRESDFSKTDGVAVAVATAGESDRNLGLRPVLESHSRHNSSWGVDVVACARVSALPGVSATASSSASAFVSVAGVAHARSTPMHDAHNSWSDTAMNSLRVQRSTSYNLQGVVAPNSIRKCDNAARSGAGMPSRP